MIVSNKEVDTGTGIGKVKGGLGNNGQCEMATVQKVNLKKGADEALRLSMTSPVPHMMDVEGKLVMAMPKSHPKMKVQIAVDVPTYKEYGLQLLLRKSCMTNKGRVQHIPRVDVLCDTGAQVDCLNVKSLKSLGLSRDQLLQPQVSVGCANETSADMVGVFFAKVSALRVD